MVEDTYEIWKNDVLIWCELTDIPQDKQALALHLSLQGKARTASSQIPVATLKSEDGVEAILQKLDDLFLMDEGRRQFSAFQKLYRMKRRDGCDFDQFIMDFENIYHEFTQQNMSLPDSVKAFMLLESCRSNEMDRHMVMSSVSEVTYPNIRASIKRIFSTDTSSSSDTKIKEEEPICFSEGQKSDDAVCAAVNFRNRSFRNENYLRRSTRQNNVNTRKFNDKEGNMNPPGRDGQPTRCNICDSKYHWARFCPDNQRNKRNFQFQRRSESEAIHMFVGFAEDKDDKEDKLDRMVKESFGSAVLDTGCSLTVCGGKWLDNYLSSLNESQRLSVREEESTSTFTFGDGVTFPSLKRMILPCKIGDREGTVTTDVVECNIPLLLSRSSMKKARMIIDLVEDNIRVNNMICKLNFTTSGHYLLNLSS